MWRLAGVLLLLAGCASRGDDALAIDNLVRQEGQGVVAQDLEALMPLWHAEAVITDANHTPDDPTDDTVWHGADAIRDRYIYLVFPGGATTATPRDLSMEFKGRRATARSTTQIEGEISPGGDRWGFVRDGDRWTIDSLTYNLEPASP